MNETLKIMPAQRATRRGFTLIELMIVIVVISILVAIAIPLFLRNRINANEASAISSMRTISTAQSVFRQQTIRDDNGDGAGDFGTLTDLAVPLVSGAPPFIDSSLGSGVKSGYLFSIEIVPGTNIKEPRYSAFAIPGAYAKTGIRNFYIDEQGVVRFTVGEAGKATLGVDSPPLN